MKKKKEERNRPEDEEGKKKERRKRTRILARLFLDDVVFVDLYNEDD